MPFTSLRKLSRWRQMTSSAIAPTAGVTGARPNRNQDQYTANAAAVLLTALYTDQSAITGYDAPIAGAMALLGHLYPVFHGFKGGKGVATAVGVLLALNPWLGLGPLASFGIMIAFFRIVSLASMTAALFAVFWSFFLFQDKPVSFAVLAIALLVIWRHRDNVLRLVNGTEPRLGAKKT